MLDNETKHRLDTLRDILVGKVPDPKSQVDQITTGLIYKFMNDMDTASFKAGGKRKFFKGEFRKYSWEKLFDPKVGGVERVKLYGEAIERMCKNPSAPPLFREIFKNTYLPFRDPSTLNMFLTEIGEFHYTHSEKLGDAYEYLLSYMGSQGDAGQFRTPRHIIDFIVEIVSPRKNETILDPACGTAGFLISSFKYIMRDKKNLWALDLNNLNKNLVGYDISPDMSRLSLVNMYLHNFTNPKIYEYDTLSSDDRWNEYFDVILANPPFFSPKGGIQPHSRFSLDSKRAEVLFVDYIIQHLKPNGRAGIIVPEGIIFQTGRAYKALRKKLVEDCLVGVISLPAGVFQPYSGVKTSILILDNSQRQQVDSLYFAKIDNDGYSLGSQRIPISENDLPNVILEIQKLKDSRKSELQIVKRSNVLANPLVSLNSTVYQQVKASKSVFPLTMLGDKRFFEIVSGGTPKSNEKSFWGGEINWISLSDLPSNNFITEISSTLKSITNEGLAKSSACLLPVDSVVVSTRATIGRVGINTIPLCTNQGFKSIVIKHKHAVLTKFVGFMMTHVTNELNRIASGGTFKEVTKSNFEKVSIPLPPIEIQQEIVTELDGYQKIIDGARQVVENYRIELDFSSFKNYPCAKLGEVIELLYGKTLKKEQRSGNGYPVYGSNGIVGYHKNFLVPGPCIIVGRKGSAGKVNLSEQNAYPIDTTFYVNIVHEEKLDLRYLYYVLQELPLQTLNTQTGVPGLNRIDAYNLEIPLPSIKLQQSIASELDAESKIVEGNKKLIEIYTKKIQDRIAKVWGE